MRLFRFWIVVVVLVMVLVGCGVEKGRVGEVFSYAGEGFSVEVRGTAVRLAGDGYTGPAGVPGASGTGVARAFSARVEVGEPTESGARALSVTFTAPESLAGLAIVRSAAGEITLTRPSPYGEIVLCGEAAASLLRFGDALLPVGDITATTPVQNGAFTVIRTAPDRTVTYTFSAEQALPAHILVETHAERLELTLLPSN